MARKLKRVPLKPETDLLHILEEVHDDRIPRIIERSGEPLVVVISPEEYGGVAVPKSKRLRKKLLSLAGAWSDLDADKMIEELYKARHETPCLRPYSRES